MPNITPRPSFLQCTNLYLSLTLSHKVLLAGLEAQYLYLQFPLIIGLWEQSSRSATHAATPSYEPPISSHETWQSTERSLGCCKWMLLLPHMQQSPAAIEVNHSLNSASHLFFFLLHFTLFYFWVLIKLKKYRSYYSKWKNCIGFLFQMATRKREGWKKIIFENILTFQNSPEIMNCTLLLWLEVPKKSVQLFKSSVKTSKRYLRKFHLTAWTHSKTSQISQASRCSPLIMSWKLANNILYYMYEHSTTVPYLIRISFYG